MHTAAGTWLAGNVAAVAAAAAAAAVLSCPSSYKVIAVVEFPAAAAINGVK